MKDNDRTHTTEGWIPHIEIAADTGIFLAPVKLARTAAGQLLTHEGKPVPVRRDGQLAYALPGGGEFVP